MNDNKISRFESLKKLCINILIGSLIAAAGLAVVSVLVGQLNDILGRALSTLGLVAAHAIASLFYIRTTNEAKNKDDLSFFSNAVFVIIILSFITSVFGTWEALGGELVGKLYATYFVALFASLHGEMLFKTLHFEPRVDKIVYFNYVFMGLVIVMILPVIFMGTEAFGGFYYRALSAAAIIDATLTILAVIFNKLYLQKHPELSSQLFPATIQMDSAGKPVAIEVSKASRRTSPLLIILGIFLLGQLVLTLIYAISN